MKSTSHGTRTRPFRRDDLAGVPSDLSANPSEVDTHQSDRHRRPSTHPLAASNDADAWHLPLNCPAHSAASYEPARSSRLEARRGVCAIERRCIAFGPFRTPVRLRKERGSAHARPITRDDTYLVRPSGRCRHRGAYVQTQVRPMHPVNQQLLTAEHSREQGCDASPSTLGIPANDGQRRYTTRDAVIIAHLGCYASTMTDRGHQRHT